jgi:hypothetical protein
MLRVVFLAGAMVAGISSGPASAGGEPGPISRRPLPPAHIAYRDPAYAARVRPFFVAPVPRAPRSLALPLYNEPPPRFPVP